MKKALFATILLAAFSTMAADEPKPVPLPQDSQVKMLKAQRDLQQVELQMDSLQEQYKQAVIKAHDLVLQMQDECTVAAKASNVDLTKYNCDVDTLTFVLKPEPKPTAAEPANTPKATTNAQPKQ